MVLERTPTSSGLTRNNTRPFIGVDGEGVTLLRPNHIKVGKQGKIRTLHEYRLLRVGQGEYGVALETGKELTCWECFNFLSAFASKKGKERPIYVAYFFNYDVTMMLKGLPKAKIEAILNQRSNGDKSTKGTSVTSPRGERFQIRVFEGKEFSIRKLPVDLKYLRTLRTAEKYEYYDTLEQLDSDQCPYMTINDVGSFFYMKFVLALESWVDTDEEMMDVIVNGKNARAIADVVDDKMRYYNEMEIVALEKMMTKFRDMCLKAGISPRKYQGPGNLAASLLAKHKVPRREDVDKLIPKKLAAMATYALHFGRFEGIMYGIIPGPIYEYDINSAYPYSMRFLPCLSHGKWTYSSVRPTCDLYLASVRFDHPVSLRTCNLPFRAKDGSICYPRQGEGMYWNVELEAAERHGTQVVNEIEFYAYEKCCDCDPFGWIEKLYKLRKEYDAIAPNLGYPLKLALNSLFGKMVQMTGEAPYFNVVYAGLITSVIRSMLIEAGGDGNDVVMYATDAIYTKNERPDLVCGPNLGEWDKKVHYYGMFIVQSGVYFGSAHPKKKIQCDLKTPKKAACKTLDLCESTSDRPSCRYLPMESLRPKTRGIPLSKLVKAEKRLRQAWTAFMEAEVMDFDRAGVEIPTSVLVGMRWADHLNISHLAGQWMFRTKKVTFDWTIKRSAVDAEFCGTYIHTWPKDKAGSWANSESGDIVFRPQVIDVSRPYIKAVRDEIEKKAMAKDWTRLGFNAQPDYADNFDMGRSNASSGSPDSYGHHDSGL